MLADARAEAERTIAALAPYAERGVPIVGLEPSCLLTLRDEFLALVPTDAARLVASHALLFEEFIARELDAGRWAPPLARSEARRRARALPSESVRRDAGRRARAARDPRAGCLVIDRRAAAWRGRSGTRPSTTRSRCGWPSTICSRRARGGRRGAGRRRRDELQAPDRPRHGRRALHVAEVYAAALRQTPGDTQEEGNVMTTRGTFVRSAAARGRAALLAGGPARRRSRGARTS